MNKEHYLKNKIKAQGRTIKWVSQNVGLSLPYLSLCLNNKRNLPKDKELLIIKLLS